MLEEQLGEDSQTFMSVMARALAPIENITNVKDNKFMDTTNIGASMMGKAAVCPRWAVISARSPFKVSRLSMAKALRLYTVSKRSYALRKLRRAEERGDSVVLGRNFIHRLQVPDALRILESADRCHEELSGLMQEYHVAFDKRVEHDGLSSRVHYLFWDDKEIIPVVARAGRAWDNRVIRLDMQLKTSMYIIDELVPLELNKGYMMFFSSDTRIPVYYSDAVKEDVRGLASYLERAFNSAELPEEIDRELCGHNDCDYRQRCYEELYGSGPAQI